ncbi:MAG: N-6 DNA methylase [Oligoflexia bacterium]|nr:N-6 DNA methylase [Oligoflexia bacterium]
MKLSIYFLAFSIKKLQDITFKDSEADESGLAFQKFISRYSREGRGQFFTLDPIVNTCVEIIQPQKNEKIIDPACGTGGFLFSSLRYIKRYKNIDLSRILKSFFEKQV